MSSKRPFMYDKIPRFTRNKNKILSSKLEKRKLTFKSVTTRKSRKKRLKYTSSPESDDNSVLLNHRFNNRITLKGDIFPNAVHTKILKKKAERPKTPKSKNPNMQRFTRLSSGRKVYVNNHLLCEENLPPGVSGIADTVLMGKSNNVKTLFNNVAENVQKTVKRSKTDNNEPTLYNQEDELLLCNFTYYSPEEAQQYVMYLQCCEFIKRRIIYERIKNFEPFPDAMTEIQQKIWQFRIERDLETSQSQRTASSINAIDDILNDDNVGFMKTDWKQMNDPSKIQSLTPESDNEGNFKIPCEFLTKVDYRKVGPSTNHAVKENVILRTRKLMNDLENKKQTDVMFDKKQNPSRGLPKPLSNSWKAENHFPVQQKVIPDTIEKNLTSSPLAYLKEVSKNSENFKPAEKSKYDTIEQNLGVPPLDFLKYVGQAEGEYHKLKENDVYHSKKKVDFKLSFNKKGNAAADFWNSPVIQGYNNFGHDNIPRTGDENQIIDIMKKTPITGKNFEIFPFVHNYYLSDYEDSHSSVFDKFPLRRDEKSESFSIF